MIEILVGVVVIVLIIAIKGRKAGGRKDVTEKVTLKRKVSTSQYTSGVRKLSPRAYTQYKKDFPESRV